MKKNIFTYIMFLVLPLSILVSSCSTNDVAPIPPGPEPDKDHFALIQDEAFGEYLLYRNVAGVVEKKDTISEGVFENYKYYVDTLLSLNQTRGLNLAKNSNTLTELINAGLRTANTKIVTIDELKYFKNINSVTLTSNSVTGIDVSNLPLLDTLALNNNLIPELNLINNTQLIYLSCNASTVANGRIQSIDLSNNTKLKFVSLTNHPGTPFTIPAAIYDNLTPTPTVSKNGIVRGN